MTTTIAKAQPPLIAALTSEDNHQKISAALPRHMSAGHYLRTVLTEINQNPDLLKCDPFTFLNAITQAAQLGLDLTRALGRAYLIPFFNNKTGKTDVTLIVGYRGLMDLVRRSGLVRQLSAHVVYEGDEFDYSFGSEERIVHRPAGETAAAKITHAYAIAGFKDGAVQMEVMTRKEIDAIRDRGRKNPVWDKDYGEMARKTVIRRICKFLPLSAEMSQALTLDVEADERFETKPQNDAKKIGAFMTLAAQDENEQRAAENATIEAKIEGEYADTP